MALLILQEYCAGEEVTITVLPPGTYTSGGQPKHWSLPIITRFNHHNGIAPYNGVVAVTANSRALTQAEHDADPVYKEAQELAAYAAELCGATAPMRIDGRRREAGGRIVLFDVNMKPVSPYHGPDDMDELDCGYAAAARRASLIV